MIDLVKTEIVLARFFENKKLQQPEIIYYLELRAAKFE